MRNSSESLAAMLAPIAGVVIPIAGVVMLCAAPAMAAPGSSVPSSGGLERSRLQPGVAQPRVTTENVTAGFRVNPRPLAALQPITLDVSRFAFTAPGRVGSSQTQTVERGFSFTPSASGAGRGVSLGMTARNVVIPTAAAPTSTLQRTAAAAPPIDAGIAPVGYNFDLSLGYRGFALSGGVTRMDTGVGGRRTEGVDVGLSYAARNWSTGIHAMAKRDSGHLVPRVGMLDPRHAPDPRFAVEASGALALSPQISLGGSVRYRLAPENPTPLDPSKDDRAVFLGGAVAF